MTRNHLFTVPLLAVILAFACTDAVPAAGIPTPPKAPASVKIATPPKARATTKIPAAGKAPAAPKTILAAKVPNLAFQARTAVKPAIQQTAMPRVRTSILPAPASRQMPKTAATGGKARPAAPMAPEKKNRFVRNSIETIVSKDRRQRSTPPENTNGGFLVTPPPADGTPVSPPSSSNTDPATAAGEMGWYPWWAGSSSR